MKEFKRVLIGILGVVFSPIVLLWIIGQALEELTKLEEK